MFHFKSLQYTTALSLTLVLSPIDSVSYAVSSMEVKDSRVISSLLKPSSILVAKKSKKPKKLTKAQRRERARINKVIRRVRAGIATSPTFAGKLQVIQDKETQISNTIGRLNKRLKSKRVKKKPSLKRKTLGQIRFNKGLLTATKQLRSEVHAAELERQRVEAERQRVEAERQRLERERLAREAEARRREAERQRLERERLSREAEERLIDHINDPAVKTAIRTLRTSNGISSEQAVNRYLNEQLQLFDNTATPIATPVTLPRFVEVYEKMHTFLQRDQLGITMQGIINRDFIDFIGMGQPFDVSQTLAIYFSAPGCNENRNLAEAMAKFIRERNPMYNTDRESKQGLEWLFYEMLQNPILSYNDAAIRINDAIRAEDHYLILNNDEKFWAAYWRSKGTPEAIKEKVLEPALRRQAGILGISTNPNTYGGEDYSGKFIKAIAKTVYDITEEGNADANTVPDAIAALKGSVRGEKNNIRAKITDIPDDVVKLAANKRIFESKDIKESLKEYLVVYLGDVARAQYRQKLIDFRIDDFSQPNSLANIANTITGFILNSTAGKNLNDHLTDFLKYKIQAQFAHQGSDYWIKNKSSLLPVAIINQVVNRIYNNGNGRIDPNTIKDTIINVFKGQLNVEGVQIQNGWSDNDWDDIYDAMIDGIDEGPLPFSFAVDKAINGNNVNWEAVRDYIAEHMDLYKVGFNFPMGGALIQQLNRFKAVIAGIYDGVEDPITMVGDEPLRDLAEALPEDLERLFRKANNIYTPEVQVREAVHQNALNLLRQQRENTILAFNPAPNRNPARYTRSDPHEKYGFVVQYLNNRPDVGLRVNFDQVRRDPYLYQPTLPADPAPGWYFNQNSMITETFMNSNHDAYTAMVKRMYDAVKAHYNAGRTIGSTSRDNALKAVLNLFSHHDYHGSNHNVTGNSPQWRQRIKRVYDAFFAGDLFDNNNVPSLALQTLMSNVNCIDGARQVLNAFEQQLGVEEQLSFEQRISLPLMKLREREAYNVAAQADTGNEQNETILHFNIVGGYALSLPLNQTTMQYSGIARTGNNSTLRDVLDNFFTRYTPQAMIAEVKAKFKPTNRAEDDRSDNIFADEVIDILKKTLKYSNHSDKELREDIFNLSPNGNVESIKDDAIKDLLVHLGYLNE